MWDLFLRGAWREYFFPSDESIFTVGERTERVCNKSAVQRGVHEHQIYNCHCTEVTNCILKKKTMLLIQDLCSGDFGNAHIFMPSIWPPVSTDHTEVWVEFGKNLSLENRAGASGEIVRDDAGSCFFFYLQPLVSAVHADACWTCRTQKMKSSRDEMWLCKVKQRSSEETLVKDMHRYRTCYFTV